MDCKKIKMENGAIWKQFRTNGIGGSDIAGVCGLSAYSSPLLVYKQKVEGYEVPQTFAMTMGTVLEQTVADMFTVQTGIETRKTGYTYVDNDEDIFIANIDRRLVGMDGILECKTCGDYSADQWDDGKVPLWYYAQVQWYLGITKCKEAYIACLIGNRRLAVVHIEPHADFIANLREQAKAFWTDYIVPQIPPAPTANDLDMVKERTITEPTISLDTHYESLFAEREQLTADKKALDEKIKDIEAKIIGGMEHAETATCGKWKVTSKPATRKSVDSKLLEKEYPDVYSAVCKETEYVNTRFSKSK